MQLWCAIVLGDMETARQASPEVGMPATPLRRHLVCRSPKHPDCATLPAVAPHVSTTGCLVWLQAATALAGDKAGRILPEILRPRNWAKVSMEERRRVSQAGALRTPRALLHTQQPMHRLHQQHASERPTLLPVRR